MANTINALQNTISAAQSGSQPRALSQQDRVLIETLLVDHGILSPGAMVTPTPTPKPTPTPAPTPTPGPTPTPAPAPAPTPTPTTTTIVVNPIVRLAMKTVSPGDLITAEFMNTLIDALLGLDERLANLEGVYSATLGGTPAPSPTPLATPTPTPGPTPTPTPQGTPTPTPAHSKSAPNLESAVATTIVGRGVGVEVTGDNIGEGLVEQVLIGTTQIALKGVRFTRTGLTFVTTSAVITKGRARLRIVTAGGEDSVTITNSKEVVR